MQWDVQGKKILKRVQGLLFKFACMKIRLFNLFCIELYANLGGGGGSFWHFMYFFPGDVRINRTPNW